MLSTIRNPGRRQEAFSLGMCLLLALLCVMLARPARAAGAPDCPLAIPANRMMAGDPQALQQLRQAGAHGDPLALAMVAQYERFRYPYLEMLPPVRQQAVLAAARAAADAGDPIGLFIYGQVLQDIGRFRHDAGQLAAGQRLLRQAVPRLRQAAQGRCAALYQFWLGDAYYNGEGVAKDLHQYFTWSLQSAEQGNLVAQGAVGLAYMYGIGVARNCAEALHWTQQSADAGYPKSQVLLGLMYKDGRCVAQDPAKAVALFRTAAKAKVVAAYTNLGICYVYGIGVRPDYDKGLKLLIRASRDGDEEAMAMSAKVMPYVMANKLLSDQRAGDRNTALKLLLESAAQGFAPARQELQRLNGG